HAGKNSHLREMILKKASQRGAQYGWHHQYRNFTRCFTLLDGTVDFAQEILREPGLNGPACSESLSQHTLQARLQAHDLHLAVPWEPLLTDGAPQRDASQGKQLTRIRPCSGSILRGQSRSMLADCFDNATHIADRHF